MGADSSLTVRCCGLSLQGTLFDSGSTAGNSVGGPPRRLETMNLLHKSQFSRVHRPIKLNLTDHRRGAICLRRIDEYVRTEKKQRSSTSFDTTPIAASSTAAEAA